MLGSQLFQCGLARSRAPKQDTWGPCFDEDRHTDIRRSRASNQSRARACLALTFTRARVVSPSQPQVDSIIEARLRPEPDLSDEKFVRQALSDAKAARAAGKPRRATLAKELGVDGTIDTVTLGDEELTALKNEELKALLRARDLVRRST